MMSVLDSTESYRLQSLLTFTPEDMMVSSQTVNLNSGTSDPIGEVVEGVARVCLEVVADVRSGVEPGS